MSHPVMDLSAKREDELNDLLLAAASYDDRKLIRKALRELKQTSGTTPKKTVTHDFAKNRMTQKIFKQSFTESPALRKGQGQRSSIDSTKGSESQRRSSVDSTKSDGSIGKSDWSAVSKSQGRINQSGVVPHGSQSEVRSTRRSQLLPAEGYEVQASEARLKREKELQGLASKSKFDNRRSLWETPGVENSVHKINTSNKTSLTDQINDIRVDDVPHCNHQKEESISDSAYSTEETISNRDELSDLKYDSHSDKECTPSTDREFDDDEILDLERAQDGDTEEIVVEEIVESRNVSKVEHVPVDVIDDLEDDSQRDTKYTESTRHYSIANDNSGYGTYFGISPVSKDTTAELEGHESDSEGITTVDEATPSGSSAWHNDDNGEDDWSSALDKLSSRRRRKDQLLGGDDDFSTDNTERRKSSRGLGNRLAGLSAYYAQDDDDPTTATQGKVMNNVTETSDFTEYPVSASQRSSNRLKGLSALYGREDESDDIFLPSNQNNSLQEDVHVDIQITNKTEIDPTDIPLKEDESNLKSSSRKSRIRSLVDQSERIKSQIDETSHFEQPQSQVVEEEMIEQTRKVDKRVDKLINDIPELLPDNTADKETRRPVRRRRGQDSESSTDGHRVRNSRQQKDVSIDGKMVGEDRPLRQPSEDRPLRQPSEDRPLRQPSEDRPLRQPSEDRPLRQPSEDRPLRQPRDLSSIKPPEHEIHLGEVSVDMKLSNQLGDGDTGNTSNQVTLVVNVGDKKPVREELKDMKPAKAVSDGVTKRLQQIHDNHEEIVRVPLNKSSPALKGDVSGIKARFQQQPEDSVTTGHVRRPVSTAGLQTKFDIKQNTGPSNKFRVDRFRQDKANVRPSSVAGEMPVAEGQGQGLLRKTKARDFESKPVAKATQPSHAVQLRKSRPPATAPKPKRPGFHRPVSRTKSQDLTDEETAQALINLVNRELGKQSSAMIYLPIESFDDLCTKFCDGGLLCKLVNWAVQGTIDERALTQGILTQEEKKENLVLAVESARAIGAVVKDNTVQQILNYNEATVKQLMLDLFKAHQVHCMKLEERRSMSIEDFSNHIQNKMADYL